MSLKLSDKVFQYLLIFPTQSPTAREISEWVFEHYPEECEEKKRNSKAVKHPIDTDEKLIKELIAEIGSKYSSGELQRKYPRIQRTEGKTPRKFYLANSVGDQKNDEVKSSNKLSSAILDEDKFDEHDLYPKLKEFLQSDNFVKSEGIKIFSKRINEKRAKNKYGRKGNMWLYPDLVGMEDLSHDWDDAIKECVQRNGDEKTKLWSFEVKKTVDESSVRESFFQAVSNSSWANFGYLVAASINGTNTLKELRMLASLHGIGFIKLDVDDPSKSQIMIQARERHEVDWNTANRLAKASKDFMDYIIRVNGFYQLKDTRVFHWDER